MAREEAYQLFGKEIRISSSDKEINGLLFPELDLYPPAGNSLFDLDIEIVPELSFDSQARNPSTHAENSDAFWARSKQLNISFQFDQRSLKKIRFQLNKSPNAFRNWAQRMMNMQYTNRTERVGQILHEEVLIPAVHFMEDRVLLHSSAVNKGDEVILLGGTGGVGKTSIELAFCLQEEGLFLADDISVISTEGFVYPHLNYPKIYGYNIQGNSELQSLLLDDAGLQDRLHWQLHMKRGPSFVRRRISPEVLYGKYDSVGGIMTRYLILSRDRCKDLSIESIAPELAAQISVDILKTEYAHFHNHLYWHRLNSKVLNREVIFDPERIFDRWASQLTAIFGKIECQLVRIPIEMEHEQFKRQMVALL